MMQNKLKSIWAAGRSATNAWLTIPSPLDGWTDGRRGLRHDLDGGVTIAFNGEGADG